MARAIFVCSGCRQSFCVMSPEGDVLTETCPIRECQRVIWVLPGSGKEHLLLATNMAPDLSSGERFVLDCYRLLDCADCPYPQEVLAGPADQLKIMAADLNADPPHDDAELCQRVRDLIQAARPGCIFQPGKRLVQAGHASRKAERR